MEAPPTLFPASDGQVTERLELIAALRAKVDELAAEQERMRQAAVPPDVQKDLDEIDAEFGPKVRDGRRQIEDLEAEVRRDVLELGHSVKASSLHAVLSAGRVSWDTRGLEGLMVAQPELARFRKVGQPSVAIRPAKGGDGGS